MHGVFTASIKITGLVAAKTLMYITTPATRVVEILSASVTNAGNETNEQLDVTFQTVNALGTPTATTITPAKHGSGAVAQSVVKANVTASEPSYVADTEVGREGFSSLGGWFFPPQPEERIEVPPSTTLGLRMLSTPTSLDVIVKITFREVG